MEPTGQWCDPADPLPGGGARPGTPGVCDAAGMSVVRISRASFPADSYDEVARRLDASQQSLVPAIRRLDGLIGYYAGADPASNTMVNVSVWDTVDHAEQMASLPEMLALAGEFVELGCVFERPIVNYRSLWEI